MASEEDLKELRELVEFSKANDIAEFEMEREDLKVSLKFANAIVHPVAAAAMDPAVMASILAAQGAAAAVPRVNGGETIPSLSAPAVSGEAAGKGSAPAATPAGVDEMAGAHLVKSPIVGTFYGRPAPDADAFVKVGDQVAVGKVLCIVEAMKLMNEIESDGTGAIVKVFVQDGQPVEYGQPLFAIK
jgi:acetyl-CoA carboxylase biotin carboxyl carrier protein